MNQKMRLSVVCMVASVLVLVFLCIGPVRADSLPQEARHALLKGDWEGVLAVLEKTEIKDADASCRLVAAHAYLATNHNNQATILFLSLEREDVAAWDSWTEALQAENPTSGIAQYLYGDAAARQGQLMEAVKWFDHATKATPKEALFWSACGVIKTLGGDFDGALLDLTHALELRRDLADAHANLGTFWVLQGVAEGAREAFDRALAANPSFALAYNGRACARFGMGDYEGALEDFEKCFDLCPALLPAGANEALVLAALAAETVPEAVPDKLGTTITTRSELATVDCSKFTSYKQITQYEDSVRALARTDVPEAIRVLSSQRARLSESRQQLGSDLTRFVQVSNQAGRTETMLQNVDKFLGVVPVSGIKANVVASEGWQVPLDLAGKGAGLVGAATQPGTAANMLANVANRTATAEIATGLGSLKALTRVSTYLLSESLYVPRTIADARVMQTSAKINLVTVQESRLQQLQGDLLAEGIRQNIDFGRLGLSDPTIRAARTTPMTPLREYRIPATAQVTAFASMAGATGQNIAPAGQKPFVLVEGAGLTDPHRLGAALHGYDYLGARTIPVPKGTDAQRWMGTLGLSPENTIVMKITPGSDPQWRPYTPPTTAGRPPGGVTTKLMPRIDRGDWPVMTSFGLAYRPVQRKTPTAA